MNYTIITNHCGGLFSASLSRQRYFRSVGIYAAGILDGLRFIINFVAMDVKQLSAEEYAAIFVRPVSPYTTADFCALNSHKVAEMRHLAFYSPGSSKALAGIIVGRRDGEELWRSPFSAPFGGLDCVRPLRLEEVTAIYRALLGHCGGHLLVTLSPEFYAPSLTAHQIYAMKALGFDMSLWLNHSYPTSRFASFEAALGDTARKHFRRASREGYEFDADASLEEAYSVISRNRRERGYPLALSVDELRQTSALIPQHYLVLRLDGEAVAAAICYRLSERVMQIIYWGHVADCSGQYPMSVLVHEVFGFALSQGYDTVDIGPSTSPEAPNESLAAFKESLGAVASLKVAGGRF